MMNLFVGSVCDNFQRIKAEDDGSATLTDEQKQWVRTKQESFFLAEKVKVDPPLDAPSNVIQRAFFILVNSEPFDMLMTIIILANVGVMCIDYHKIEEDEGFYTFYTAANGYLLTKPSEIRAAVETLVADSNERARLGFEARKSVTTANWQRVVRALLLSARTGTPLHEQFSDLPAQRRWSKRLGHAHPWRSAKYDSGTITLKDRTLHLDDLGALRQTMLERSVPKRDQ